MEHPRRPRPVRHPFERRDFLKGSALLALALGAPTLLTACGGDDGGGGSSSSSEVPLSRPDNPVTLPLYDDNPAIEDGLEPETGTLRVFNYAEYTSPDVVKAFGEEFGVTVEVTTFNTMDEAIAKLRTGDTKFDVFFPTPDIIGKAAVGKLLQPLNKSYVPNLTNVWDELQDPFYDQGSQYSVPYTVYTTGVFYRADLVAAPPTGATGGYDLLWDTAYAGKAWLLDDDREAISMSLLRDAVTDDINTEDPADVDKAVAALSELIDSVNIKLGTAPYSAVPEGLATVHQAWSGDAINGQYYLPEGVDASVLGYWYPEGGGGVIGSDSMAVVRASEKPVLAHTFINYMLDPDNALANFEYVGYQPPQKTIDPDSLVTDEYVAPNLASTVVRQEDYATSLQICALTPDGERVWDDAWATFKSGQ